MSEMATMDLKAVLYSVDSKENVGLAIKELFPNAIIPINKKMNGEFPIIEEKENIEINNIDYSYFIQRIHDTKVADTALDCMSQNIIDNCSTFEISRQAALAGKIAFVLPNEKTLGGTFELTLNSPNLIAWIEEVTWNIGREEIPR